MQSRGPEDSKNVKTSQAYFLEGFKYKKRNYPTGGQVSIPTTHNSDGP